LSHDVGASRTILVVEDEPFIRLDIADFLRGCGFNVIEAGDAAQAIAVIESGSAIDMVFSDIQMPGPMDGLGLARWILSNRPDLKLILTSGSTDAIKLAGELCAHAPVPKPYDHRTLADRFTALIGQIPLAI